MIAHRAAALIVAVLLVGCTTIEPAPTLSEATASTTPSASASPTVTFPQTMNLDQDLVKGGAKLVVQRMMELTEYRPALKLDVTETDVTLTVLNADDQPQTLRWQDNIITQVDSDVQYLDQSTFRPTDYPLGNVGELFEAATKMGATGENLMLQIVEYRRGDVYMTVTTRPETKTVFFEKDGSALRNLGVTSVGDLTDGLSAVIAGSRAVTQVGLDPVEGYWADLPPSNGITERRTRIAALPVYLTRRSEASDWPTFDPTLIDTLVLARAINQFNPSGNTGCRVEIDNRFNRDAPTIRYDCAGTVTYTDLEGTGYTEDELRGQ